MRWTGVAAVAVLWTTVGLGMAVTGLGLRDERPISYLGTVPETAQLFRMGLVVAAALLAAFSLFLRSVENASVTFLAASLIGLVGQVVVAVVPLSGPGSASPFHTAGGLVLGASLPVLMWRFAASRPPGEWRRTAYRLCWLEVAACAVGILLSRSGRAATAEILPALGFHLWIAVVTVRSNSSEPVAAGRVLDGEPGG